MTTDRELLEAAAKAAGHGVEFDDRSGLSYFGDRFAGILWDPLNNDGDALRLAIELRLSITFTSELGRGYKNEFMQVSPRGMGHLAEFGPLGSDPGETIRRAIVRAAAALHPNGGSTQ